jgi:hypothetical protein
MVFNKKSYFYPLRSIFLNSILLRKYLYLKKYNYHDYLITNNKFNYHLVFLVDINLIHYNLIVLAIKRIQLIDIMY